MGGLPYVLIMSDHNADGPLPPGWSRGFSNSQKKHFYFHKETKTTQWHFPTASEARDPTVAKRRVEEAKKREAEKMTQAKAPPAASADNANSSSKRPRVDNDFLELADSTSVAIIVPFRDIHAEQKREAHLKLFVPHMIQFLGKCQKRGLVSNFHIYIVEQSNDGLKFNRGKLLNIGFDIARKSKKKHDVFIFHDVDLLPADDLMTWYSKFPQRPIHIARVWNRYSNNPKYFGGVVSFSSSDYKRINGVSDSCGCVVLVCTIIDGSKPRRRIMCGPAFYIYCVVGAHLKSSANSLSTCFSFSTILLSAASQYPNNFWGWGGEDDEMQRRLERLGIRFDSPDKGTLRDLEDMDINQKMEFLRQHKDWKCQVKWEMKDEHAATWKTNGLADLKYSMLKQTPLDEHGKATKLTTDIKKNGTHWTNEKAALDFIETSWKK